MSMKIVAMLAAYNEERYIRACLEHWERQGVWVYLIDNDSEDRTVAIAREYLDRNLLHIERMARNGLHVLGSKLRRKQALCKQLGADWYIHADLDEFRLPPSEKHTLAEAIRLSDSKGFNAVNFREFVFIPTLEEPDHDHPDFLSSMRHYYPFEPIPRFRINAWKNLGIPVNLEDSGGHRVHFEGKNISDEPYKMRHYHFLSIPHAASKLVGRPYSQQELDRGMHGWRARIKAQNICLPSNSELRPYRSDDELDFSAPWKVHHLGKCVK